MTPDDKFIGSLEAYLDEYEGMTPLPDPVRDAVRAQLPMTKQLGRFSGPMRRFTFMNNNIVRFGLAAAAIVLVAILGIRFLPWGNVGSDASPTPVPKPTPTPVVPAPIGNLEPGTYAISDVDPPIRTTARFTFEVPAGWSGRGFDLQVSKNSGQPGELNFMSYIVTHVYADACASEGTLTEVGPTVDDLVAALVNQVNSDASTPADVEVGGYPAKRLEMSIPAELDTSTCREPDLLIQIWSDAAENDFFAIAVDPAHPSGAGVVYVVDVNGERVVIVAGGSSDASAADIAELDGILASIHFEP